MKKKEKRVELKLKVADKFEVTFQYFKDYTSEMKVKLFPSK